MEVLRTVWICPFHISVSGYGTQGEIREIRINYFCRKKNKRWSSAMEFLIMIHIFFQHFFLELEIIQTDFKI